MKKAYLMFLVFVSIPWDLYGTKPKSSKIMSWKRYRQETIAQQRAQQYREYRAQQYKYQRRQSVLEKEMPEMVQQKGYTYRVIAGIRFCLSNLDAVKAVVLPAALAYDWYFKQHNTTDH